MNFILKECTFLRYFIPLTIEGNKRNIKSRYFIYSSGKYNCPITNKNAIRKLSEKYKFDICEGSDIKLHSGLTFLVEGVGADYLGGQHKKVSITYMTDFTVSYPKYIDKVDFVILPGKFISDYYKIPKSPKNIYLGSPKYDIILNKKNFFIKLINPAIDFACFA